MTRLTSTKEFLILKNSELTGDTMRGEKAAADDANTTKSIVCIFMMNFRYVNKKRNKS